jgi:hypothetical protein
MATITLAVTSAGHGAERCTVCGLHVPEGELLHAVVWEPGRPAGVLCGTCVEGWREAGLIGEDAGG